MSLSARGMMNNIVDNFVAPKCDEKIVILQQDEHYIVINKPSGLLSLSGKNPLNKDSVHHRMSQDYPEVTMVHRLDLGTSGIMLLALNKATNGNLTKQFQSRTVTKTYISVVHDHIKIDKGIIEAPIAKDAALFPKLKVCYESGKPAQTRFEVLARFTQPNASLVRYYPITGRTHQLRIHSQYIGHPILGCDLYGTAASYKASKRLLLHAQSLQFDHPITGNRIEIVNNPKFLNDFGYAIKN